MDQPIADEPGAEQKRLRSQFISDVALALIGVAFAISGLVGGVDKWRLGAGAIMIIVGVWAAINANRNMRRLAAHD